METKPVNAKTVKVIEPEELSFEEGVGTTFRPALIECARIGCTHTFFLIRARQRPTLCLTHSEEESRSEDGWTPENSVD